MIEPTFDLISDNVVRVLMNLIAMASFQNKNIFVMHGFQSSS